jgi:putative ABC transport system permease protein
MLKSYVITALRSMKRHKTYAAVNILGLTIGLAAGLALFAHVAQDLRWDGFHAGKDRIFLLTQKESYEGADMEFTSMIVPPLAPALVEEIPEIEATARFGARDRLVIRKDDHDVDERLCCFADASFLKIFSFPMIHGDPETALDRPDAICLRDEVARRHFGDENPVGKILFWGGGRRSVVTGVFTIPATGSHLDFNALSPASSVIAEGRRLDDWERGYVTAYVLLKPNADPVEVSDKIAGVMDRHLGRTSHTEFSLVPLGDLHLRTQHVRISWNAGKGNIVETLGLGAIGVFLVLIACVNYTNLATARCAPRFTEIGLRKVVGAKNRDLRLQFLSESVTVAAVAAILAVVAVELSRPWLSRLAGRPFHLNLGEGVTLFGLLALTVVVGVLSGLYPAFVLSSFRPSDVLKRSVTGGKGSAWFRRGLVAFQFFLSVSLLIGVGVVHKQVVFMRTKDLGFSPDRVIFVPISGNPAAFDHRMAMRDRFSEVPGVEAVGLSGSLPGLTYARSNFVPEGQTADWAMDMVVVDGTCFDVYRFRLLQGRFFSGDFPSDRSWGHGSGALVLNETAVRRLGWDNPLGKKIAASDLGAVGTVIGVVEDFHNQSLHEPIEPIVLADLGWDAFLNVRLSPVGMPETLSELERIWTDFAPGAPLPFRFIDDEFGRLYQNEKRIGALAGVFTALALCIAALGVLGLTSYMIERRTKEIGIRKVLGASLKSLVFLFSKEFILCVLAGNLVAWPVAFILTTSWLRAFAYRTSPGVLVFALSLALTVVLASATIGLTTSRTAGANPVQSLRYE